MLKNVLVVLISFTIINLSLPSKCYAQNGDVEALVEDTKTDLLIVISGGLGGAILGLSTLSFVDEPKKHTRNILVGSSLGVIAGVAFVAYTQANKSQEMFYKEGSTYQKQQPEAGFGTYARLDWHNEQSSNTASLGKGVLDGPLQLSHTIHF